MARVIKTSLSTGAFLARKYLNASNTCCSSSFVKLHGLPGAFMGSLARLLITQPCQVLVGTVNSSPVSPFHHNFRGGTIDKVEQE